MGWMGSWWGVSNGRDIDGSDRRMSSAVLNG